MSRHAVLFLLAAAFLFVAHALRALRWNTLLPRDRISCRYGLLMGLALGYAFNTVLPLHLGELIRIGWVGWRERVRFTEVAVTVAAERLHDLVAVAVIAMAITVGSDWRVDLSGLALLLALLAAVLLLFAHAIVNAARARYLLWQCLGVFNPLIRLRLLEFAWGFSEMVTSGAMLKWRFVGLGIAMWCAYLLSYLLLGWSIGGSFDGTFRALLGSPLLPTWEGMGVLPPGSGAWLVVYTSVPVACIVIYGAMTQWSSIQGAFAATLRRYAAPAMLACPARQRFRSAGEFDRFLASLFAGDATGVRQFGLVGVGDAAVHKFFHGGSDAVTALVETRGRLTIRKFASGDAGARLKVQRDWLQAHGQGVLPVVGVVGESQGRDFYHYDMPLERRATDFYEAIHTRDPQASLASFCELLRRLGIFHAQHAAGEASAERIRDYLQAKAVRNAVAVRRFVREVFPHERYEINGVPHAIDEWDRLTDLDWLTAQVRSRGVGAVHGDLTIENIIAVPRAAAAGGPDFYLIDPNPENIFDSPLIDYAKLMQSLHLGYEALNRGRCVSIDGHCIHLALAKSHQYVQLHDRLEAFIVDQWGEDVLREVYFHEIVHYLRLTPYKIRQGNELAAMTFFASTSHLLRRYLERYEGGGQA